MKTAYAVLVALALTGCQAPQMPVVLKAKPVPTAPPMPPAPTPRLATKRVAPMSVSSPGVTSFNPGAARLNTVTVSPTGVPFEANGAYRLVLTNLTHAARYRVDASPDLTNWQEIITDADGADIVPVYDYSHLFNTMYFYRLVPLP